MKKSLILTSLKKRYTYKILDSLEVSVVIKENPYDLSLNDLFCMAARKNKKRSFLFVSKILGKHIPISPQKGQLVGQLLALRYSELDDAVSLEKKELLLASFLNENPEMNDDPFIGRKASPVIIGFAETATALGHSFFDCFQSADYFHTTRENLLDLTPLITFEEEHSHATSHRCYIDEEIINNNREVILVDDEVTTGKTALNIIRSIHERFPRTVYTLVSILDWRSQQDRSAFSKLEQELGIKIHCVSLVSGEFEINGIPDVNNSKPLSVREGVSHEMQVEMIGLKSVDFGYDTVAYSSTSQNGKVNPSPYIAATGRFGLKAEDVHERNKLFEDIGRNLKAKRTGNKTLCLGTGEFMYMPMKISSEMGSGVYYQSTTRSPVHVQNNLNYGARYGLSFSNPEDSEIENFIYNIPPAGYDEIFLFFERKVEEENLKLLLEAFSTLEIPSLKIVFFTGDDEIVDDE